MVMSMSTSQASLELPGSTAAHARTHARTHTCTHALALCPPCPFRAELEAVQKGAERHRRKLLQTLPVVGATCCSLLRPVLEGGVFSLLVLDECSQLTEPLSLVPIVRANARCGMHACTYVCMHAFSFRAGLFCMGPWL
jgi:hypothetical protein